MLCAPAVVWEISAPPSTPRGTSRSSPGLTTFIVAPSSSPRVYRCAAAHFRGELDLERRLDSGLVIDLECGVRDLEALPEQPLEHAAQLMAVLTSSDDDVRRQGRKARGQLPHMEVVNLHDPWLGREDVADRLGIDAGRRRLEE